MRSENLKTTQKIHSVFKELELRNILRKRQKKNS